MKSYKTTNYEFYSLKTILLYDGNHEITFRFENTPNDNEEENLYVYMSKEEARKLFDNLRKVLQND